MLFNSLNFLIFFPIFFIIYWTLAKQRLILQNILILISSYIFYGFWSWKFLTLLFIVTFLDYVYGFFVSSSNPKKAKFFLVLSIVHNLGILCYFKYFNFFLNELQIILYEINIKFEPKILYIVVPIGISFYTFHGLSYIFDIYYKRQKPVLNFIDYAVFVSFFPLLVAGPIERANHLLPQVQNRRLFNSIQLVSGLRLVLWGTFKKLVIADNLALFVNPTYDNFQNYNGITLILATLSFSFQIYCDFSGYSDIAIGISKLLGFELLSNFKFPYFSKNIGEFWSRWHISLSSWFKDYLYIPLGGSKNGLFKTIRNTFIVFIFSGFWHGAGWNFIFWGLLHAIAFIPNLILRYKFKKYQHNQIAFKNKKFINDSWKIIPTFLFINFSWIFFRLEGTMKPFQFIVHIFSSITKDPGQIFTKIYGKKYIIYIIVLVVLDYFFRQNERTLKFPESQILRWLIYIFFIMSIVIFMSTDSSSFIYFQF